MIDASQFTTKTEAQLNETFAKLATRMKDRYRSSPSITIMDYPERELPTLTWEIFQGFLVQHIQRKYGQMIIVDTNVETLRHMICTILQGDKGIYVFGDVGSGKSVITRAIVQVSNALHLMGYTQLPYFQGSIEWEKLIDKCLAGDKPTPWTRCKTSALIDDFIYVNPPLKYNYNEVDLPPQLIYHLEKLHQGGARFVFNSNVVPAQLETAIGRRAFDRLRSMVKAYYWDGTSMRG